MSKRKKKSKKNIETDPSSASLNCHTDRDSSISSETMNQKFSGQLLKYTNVVKRWQHRWFVLDPSTGMLHYYLSESESSGHPRGGIHLQGALICPSDEDSHTFTVNSSSGEVFKLRATDARARQEWVNKLRSVAEHYSNFHKYVTTKDSAGLNLHSGVFVHGTHIHSPATSESFSSAKEHLNEAEQKCLKICKAVENLPAQGSITCVDPQLLLLKACSQSLIMTLRDCADILQNAFAADCGFQPASLSISDPDSGTSGSGFVSYVKKK